MAKRLVFSSFIWVVTACSGVTREKESDHTLLSEGFRDVANQVGICNQFWSSQIEFWNEINGNEFNSVATVRNVIANDNQSLFSALVRESWAHQARKNQVQLTKKLGEWPVSHSDYQMVMPDSAFQEFNDIPENCASSAWLEDFILRIFRNSDGRVLELGDLKLNSPYSKHWAIYWIFANIDKQEK